MTTAAGLCLPISGCAAPTARQNPESSAEKTFTINIDRSRNGSAASTSVRDKQSGRPPRTLAFRVTGRAPRVAQASTEARAASAQAAIVDALIKALIEARTARGQTVGDFSVKIGPRLTIEHHVLAAGYEAKIALNHRGVEKNFVVRDGVLQHPPEDFELIQRLFDETNGEFSLWSIEDSSPNPGAPRVMATVGCYLPTGFDPSIPDQVAGDAVVPSP
jgi:hypothetical protein